MARFTAWFSALTFAAYQFKVQAAPLSSRAGIASFIQCNASRLKIVANLAGTTSAVQSLAKAAGNDAATTSATTSAQAGLKDAQTGIATIAKALISGQAPPAAARDQVGKGLNAAQTALSGIKTTNQAVTQQLTNAQNKLKQTISAGQQVVDTCGGGGATGTSLSSVATASMTATQITTSSVTGSVTGTANVGGTTTANNAEATNSACAATSVVTSVVTVTVQPTASAVASGTASRAVTSALSTKATAATTSAVAGSGALVSSSIRGQATASPVVASGSGKQGTQVINTAAPTLGANANANAAGTIGKVAQQGAKASEFQTPGIVPRRQTVAM